MYVYAKDACVVAWTGGQTVLAQDQIWATDSALAQERPDLFTDEPTTVHGRRAPTPAVETADQAPGQKRTRTRIRKGPQ